MNILDIRTVLFSYILSAAICAGVMGSLWLQYRQDSPGLGFWLADFAMQFVGILLIALRGTIPDLVSILPGTPLLLVGTLLLYIGLEQYVDRRTSQRVNFILLAVFIMIHIFFVVGTPSMQIRNINFSAGLILYCSQIAWLMLKRVGANEIRATRMVGIFFVVFSLISLLRIGVDLAIPSANELFKSGLYDTLVILTYQMLFIILTFSLILMVNRRLFIKLEQDISQRMQTEIVLKDISMHDALTGLYNYGFFNEEMTRLENGREFPVSIMMLDVDDLKITNDNLGHSRGDDLLVTLAQVLKTAFRQEDVVARIGGDEFAVLLPNTDLASAQNALDRVRHFLDEYNASHPEMPIHISIGLSTATGQLPLAELLKKADADMYNVKKTGKFKQPA